MRNAEGQEGKKGTFGKASPWLACYGTRDTKTVEGLAILQHPSSHGVPAPWFTRDYGFLSPTPMYWPADGKATSLSRRETLQLAYRVLVFSGTPESLPITKAYEEFSKEKPTSPN